MLLIIAFSAVLTTSDPKLPPGITCETIRAMVAEHGRAKAIYWARSQGYTWAQINEARKCVG